MFRDDQARIANWAWQDEKNLIDVMLFVRVTIRMHFRLVPKVMDKWRKYGVDGLARPQDRAALPSIRMVAHQLRRDMSPKEMLLLCLRIKGIGITKAGFIVQLLLGEIGCLDSHNLEWFGIKPGQFDVTSKTPFQTVLKKVDLYIAVCAAQGTPEFLWNNWCNRMADNRPTWYISGGFVSYLHVACILGV